MTIGAVVILMVMILTVAVVSMGFLDRWGGFMNIIGGNEESSERRICQKNVEIFCNDNPGEKWGQYHENCKQYRDIIDENGDTTCSGSSESKDDGSKKDSPDGGGGGGGS